MKPYTHILYNRPITVMVSENGDVVCGKNAGLAISSNGKRSVRFCYSERGVEYATSVNIDGIVAKLYNVPNPENLRTIRHKDGNLLNDAADNLEYYRQKANRSIMSRCVIKYNKFEKKLTKK